MNIEPLVDPDKPSASERQCTCEFVNYRRAHGRMVGIWVGNDNARPIVCKAARQKPPSDLSERILPSRENSICCRT